LSTTSPSFDYIIVGHGIAGALLGYFAEKAGKRCLFIDQPNPESSTQVAAGIINPITGRRFVKSWRVEDLLPFAEKTYRALEQELGISFYHTRPLIRTLFNRGDENNWQARILEPAYEPYYIEPVELGALPQITQPAFSYMQVAQTAQVSIGKMANALKAKRKEVFCLLEEEFVFDELAFTAEGGVSYKDYVAEKVIFCEGWRSRFNPWFGHLPFGGNKGQVLLVRLPEAKLARMFKHRIFIVPFEDDLYWVGATSDNQFTDAATTEEAREYLLQRLEEVLTTPYELVDHRAAIRPTVKDRRPFIGLHPEHPQLGIFNGMGTKGASLAPFWASHFVAHLIDQEPLDTTVDIQRFYCKLDD
jgi:glycine oxidase